MLALLRLGLVSIIGVLVVSSALNCNATVAGSCDNGVLCTLPIGYVSVLVVSYAHCSTTTSL
jgi:hypothetical protein